ncbi:ATP phosphoribosyltransferase regulatory subunit [Thiococcus pfennigii]|jgi:ATP phosphoribosyltransferase regulatory subunit|uniref:ATP phosphoribosyltransferase regulatory subunit n=1 Tax=Thiococcus pfennigii TaxID=1057 RepID=UPI001904DE97|nr:ATP phosphoribosyltransferase regulatory subunit [Thiococcus pfennigii]MBK1700449.1 ATP phosphoribosyltransferase regulatory subunit [Thiococcus pfennigii]MBK1731306.1 ATP phosphoribosyltransferase regulatory subunit [Thiococcus pfennigii]
MDAERWLLPVGIEEILPPRAEAVEGLRRELLDLYRGWGYELVFPPFIDYLDSLLTGTGHDLDLQTFKLTDQVTGRMLGVRADMTPQVARIDAHELRREGPARLCYLGTVLRTRPDGFAGTRSPLQVGAEVYGHAGPESDVEILRLVMLTLGAAGIDSAYLDLGHVGIFRGLARQAGLSPEQETALFSVLQRKALPEIEALIATLGVAEPSASMLLALAELCGDDALERAAGILRAADPGVREALDYLRRVADELRGWLPEVPIHFDLAELRGYRYKTGVVFAAFVPGWGQEIARGGRYDDIGRVFGRARPAVGFSADLKDLLRHGAPAPAQAGGAVFAPWSTDAALQAEIVRLRRAGRRVVTELPGQAVTPAQLGCEERLVREDGLWILTPCD